MSEPAPSRPRVLLLTGGEVGRLTGGNLYVRRTLAALAAGGVAVDRLVLPADASGAGIPSLQALLPASPPAALLVDSVVLVEVAGLLRSLRESGCRVILLMLMLPSDLAPAADRQRVRALEAEALSIADLVVAASTSVRDILVAAGTPERKLRVVEPGRDGVTPTGRRGERHGGPFRFLCVANWSEGKGIHDAVRAFALAGSGARLELVGDEGRDRYSAEVRALIDGLGVGDRVQVRGMLEGTALAGCYERADAFVLPSRSEGFGTVYAEAFNFGLPVLGYRVPSLSWLEGPAGPGAALLVSPGDVPALGEAMASLVADAALRDRMAAVARLKAATLPTWHESERSFTEVVGAAIDRASGA